MDEISKKVDWHVVDASQTIEEVQANINQIVKETIQKVEEGKPLYKMFSDGVYVLPKQGNKDGATGTKDEKS